MDPQFLVDEMAGPFESAALQEEIEDLISALSIPARTMPSSDDFKKDIWVVSEGDWSGIRNFSAYGGSTGRDRASEVSRLLPSARI